MCGKISLIICLGKCSLIHYADDTTTYKNSTQFTINLSDLICKT